MTEPDAWRRHRRWTALGEALATAVLIAPLVPVLRDLWGGTWTELAARIEQGLALSAVLPLEAARDAGFLDPADPARRALPWGFAVLLAGTLTGLAAALDPAPGTQPTWRRRLAALPWMMVVGPPLLLASLAFVFLGLALDPLVFVGALGAGVAGGAVGASRRRDLLPWERSLSGLPPALWPADHVLRFGLLAGLMGAVLGAATLAGLPFEDAPMRLLQALDAGTPIPRTALPWTLLPLTVVGVALAPHTRRAAGLLSWEPVLASALGAAIAAGVLYGGRGPDGALEAAPLGAALALLGSLLGAAGVPILPRLAPNPVRAVGRLALPLAAALAVLLHVVATGLLGCDDVAADARVRRLAVEPGAAAIAFVAEPVPAVFAAWDQSGLILRLTTDGAEAQGIGPESLQLSEAGAVRPRAFGTAPGRVFLLADVGEDDSVALVDLDPADAGIRGVAEAAGPCGVTTWGWNPLENLGLVGCRRSGSLLLYEPNLRAFLGPQPLPGRTEVQAMAVDPLDGAVVALARRSSPFLVRYDLTGGRPLNWLYLGMGNKHLQLDRSGVVEVPRFLARQVLALDAATLQPLGSAKAGFALTVLEPLPRHGRSAVASMLDGHLYAADALGGRSTERIHVGGGVRGLAASDDGRMLYAAGLCGVLEVDLDGWLGAPGG